MIVVFDEIARLQQRFAEEFQEQAAEVIARREKFIVALPGGSVASTFFPKLAALAVDWAHVEVFWVDERAVPPEHPDSNYALASNLFLKRARVPAARVHRMHGELPELDQAARRASDELKSIAGDPPQLDLALVGIGADGHVASLFPGVSAEARSAKADGPELQPHPDPVIAVHDAPKPPARRLTMTLPVLAGASRVIVAAFGSSKAAAIERAFDAGSTTPLAELLRRAPSVLVLIDRQAGLS
jgi:6-phosphogluconolactonase